MNVTKKGRIGPDEADAANLSHLPDACLLSPNPLGQTGFIGQILDQHHGQTLSLRDFVI